MEKWDALDLRVCLEVQENKGLMDLEEMQGSLDHLEQGDPQECAQRGPKEPQGFQA